VDAVAARLPTGCVQLQAKVQHVSRTQSGRWQVEATGQAPQIFDALIHALPACSSALIEAVDQPLGTLLKDITCASCSIVVLGYRRSQIKRPLNAFGFVVPAIEKRKVIAGSFASVKFPGRAPDDRVLIRVFVGGALQPDLATLPDDELVRVARDELEALLGASGEPEVSEVVRWLGAMPQYHVGHLDLVAQIEARVAEIPRFALAGNAYRGVGIPFCIRSGEQAAERMVEQLAHNRG
jgi:oxygen-dependent protoporphyrinogen oxidase